MSTCDFAPTTAWAILPETSRLPSELPGIMLRIAGAATRQRLCLALCASGHLTVRQVALLLAMTPAAVAQVVTSAADELDRTQAPDFGSDPLEPSADDRRHVSPDSPPARTPGWYRSRDQGGHSYWDGSSWNPWVPEQSRATER